MNTKCVLLMIVALILMLCGVARAEMTAWGLFDRDTAGLRVGIEKNGNEVGLFGAWRADPSQPPNLFGIYGLHNFQAIEVNNPIPVEWLPEKWTATPYAGAYVTIDFAEYLNLPEDTQNRRMIGGPMAGLKLFDILVLEYRYQLVNDYMESAFENGQSVFALGLFKKF